MDLNRFQAKRKQEDARQRAVRAQERESREIAAIMEILKAGPATTREIAAQVEGITQDRARVRLHQLHAVRDYMGRWHPGP